MESLGYRVAQILSMVVLRSASPETGKLCAVMRSGMTRTLGLCVDNLDMDLNVTVCPVSLFSDFMMPCVDRVCIYHLFIRCKGYEGIWRKG